VGQSEKGENPCFQRIVCDILGPGIWHPASQSCCVMLQPKFWSMFESYKNLV